VLYSNHQKEVHTTERRAEMLDVNVALEWGATVEDILTELGISEEEFYAEED
jgi:hypothetical protein